MSLPCRGVEYTANSRQLTQHGFVTPPADRLIKQHAELPPIEIRRRLPVVRTSNAGFGSTNSHREKPAAGSPNPQFCEVKMGATQSLNGTRSQTCRRIARFRDRALVCRANPKAK